MKSIDTILARSLVIDLSTLDLILRDAEHAPNPEFAGESVDSK